MRDCRGRESSNVVIRADNGEILQFLSLCCLILIEKWGEWGYDMENVNVKDIGV